MVFKSSKGPLLFFRKDRYESEFSHFWTMLINVVILLWIPFFLTFVPVARIFIGNLVGVFYLFCRSLTRSDRMAMKEGHPKQSS